MARRTAVAISRVWAVKVAGEFVLMTRDNKRAIQRLNDELRTMRARNLDSPPTLHHPSDETIAAYVEAHGPLDC